MAAHSCMSMIANLARRGRTSQWEAWSGLLATGASVRSYAVSGISQVSPTKLHEVMKMDELVGKSSQEIAEIWLQYHSDPSKGRAGSVIMKDEWELIKERAKKSPMFVLPLAKPNSGYVTLLTQHQLPITLITSLEEYKRYGPGAPAAVTLTHYTELLDRAGLVLVRADVVNNKLVNTAEARTLMELLRALYTDHEDYKMVLDFNHNPTAFDFTALLKKMGIESTA